ncbi:MAG TPA: AAA family ATPase, partial [Anaerolineaceae bacterium]|nr:AAA family ATPase [Anaerolineaceae bacterium]
RTLRQLSAGLSNEPIALVGRSEELQILQDTYKNSLKNKCLNIITLSGETGIGKTRLAQEFCAAIGENTRTNPLCLQASSAFEDSHTPFALLRNLLAGHYQLDVSAPPEVIRTKLEREFRVLLRADGIEAAHLVGHLAGFDFSTSPFIQRYRENANSLRQRALQLCPRYFQALAGSRPLIIVVDDLQWTDPDSLTLLDTLVKNKIDFPAVLLCLARPSFLENHISSLPSSQMDRARSNWGQNWPNHLRLELSPLTNEQVNQLNAALLHLTPQQLPPALVDALQERANGNPFFISEMIRMWFKDGAIQQTQNGWIINPQAIKRQKIPSTLTEVMQARLDSLPIPERDLLKRAAVIGRVFWNQALEALAPHTSEDTGDLIQQLVSMGLIMEQSASSIPGCREYNFTHSLLYQVTYENVLIRMRPGYHARAANWLEQQAARVHTDMYAASIAEHYEKAGQSIQSALWYERAGDYAVGRYQPEIALEFFQNSLQFAQNIEIDQRLSLLKKIGDMLWWIARYSQALDIAGVQAETAQTYNQPAVWADALNRMSAIQNRLGGHVLGLQYTNQAETIARQVNALPELAAALFYRGVSLYRLGNNKEAQATAEQALELNTEMEKGNAFPSARAEIIRCLNLLGMVHQTQGDYSIAQDYFTRVMEYHRANNNPSGAIAALNNLGVHAHIRGDYTTAIANYCRALEEARLVGYRDLEWICQTNLCGAQAEMGEYKQAETGLRQVLENSQGSAWFLLSETKRFMALALLGQRHRQEALEYAREALDLARKSGSREYMGRAWRVLGMIAAQNPSGKITLPVETTNPDNPPVEKDYSAQDCFSISQDVFVQSGGAGELARTRREWARFEFTRGDPQNGQMLWAQARASFEQLGMPHELQRMLDEYSDDQ